MSGLRSVVRDWNESENARGIVSLVFSVLFSWVWVLQILFPWWETWHEEPTRTSRIATSVLVILFIGTYSYGVYRLYFTRHSWTEIFTAREGWLLRILIAGAAIPLVLGWDGAWPISLIFVVIMFVFTAPPLQGTMGAIQGAALAAVVLVAARVDLPTAASVMALSLVFGLMIALQMRQGGELNLAIEARYREACVAAAEERLRISRDLHDVLGHTLSLLTLKSELASRLIDADPERARQEIREVEQLARSAMGDVRRTVSEERRPIFAAEIDDARQLLDAAGIALAVRADATSLPDEVATLFAWGVREGVTNTVRHSRATRCEIRLWQDDDEARLTVTDNGAGSESPGAGTGIANLCERAEALGGSVSFDILPNTGGHRLCLTVPVGQDGN